MLISLNSCSLAQIHGLSVLFLAILLGVKSIGSYPPSSGMSIRRRLRMCATMAHATLCMPYPDEMGDFCRFSGYKSS